MKKIISECKEIESKLPNDEKKWSDKKYNTSTKRQLYDRKNILNKKICRHNFVIENQDKIDELKNTESVLIKNELINAENNVKEIKKKLKNLEKDIIDKLWEKYGEPR